MAISKKSAPSIPENLTSNVINSLIDELYDHLNELINAVNQGNTTKEKPSTQGKSGDIQVVRGSDGKYYLDIKTDEGWLRSSADTFELR